MSLLSQAKPCPWGCRDGVWLWADAGKFSVGCSNPRCAATGPKGGTEAEAVLLWNLAPRRGQEHPLLLKRVEDEMTGAARRDLERG